MIRCYCVQGASPLGFEGPASPAPAPAFGAPNVRSKARLGMEAGPAAASPGALRLFGWSIRASSLKGPDPNFCNLVRTQQGKTMAWSWARQQHLQVQHEQINVKGLHLNPMQ